MSFRVANDIVLNETNLTTSDVASEVLDCTNIYGLSVHAISTGTVAGAVEIQVSNDKINWVTLSSPSITITNTTNDAVQVADLFYKWARINYNAISGTTNTLEVHITTKGI